MQSDKVLARSPNDAMARFVKGDILRAGGTDFEVAIAEYEAAIAINPSLEPAYAALARRDPRRQGRGRVCYRFRRPFS